MNPHPLHASDSAAPHFEQKRRPSRFSAPQPGHVIARGRYRRSECRSCPSLHHERRVYSIGEVWALSRIAGQQQTSLDDATGVRDRARRSLYSGKAAAARAHVVRTLVSQLERLTSAIDEVDCAATTLLPPSEPGTGPSDAELLQTIPGIGPQTAATLLGELGALTRFTDARALVAYVGFYPVINESGDRAAPPRLSPVGSRIARHSLYLAAVNAVRRSGEWRTIYLRKKAQGKTAKQALIVVAVKLLHAVYAMLKHRQPYNPSRLLVAPATIGS